MLNPAKVSKFFSFEKRSGRKYKLKHMKCISIQENNRYNLIEWKTEANIIIEIFKQYKNKYWYMINPFSLFRHVWDTIWTLCFLSFIIILPMRVAVNKLGKGQYISISQIPVDGFFLASVIINFWTGFYDPYSRTVTYTPSVVAIKYFRGYFLVDLISSLPYDATLNYLYNFKIPNMWNYIYLLYHFKLLRFPTFLANLKKVFYFCSLSGLYVEIFCLVLVWIYISYFLLTLLYFFSDYYELESVLSNDPTAILKFVHDIANYVVTTSTRLVEKPTGTHSQKLGKMVTLFLTIIFEPFIGACVIVLYWSTCNNDVNYRGILDEVNVYANGLSAPDLLKKKIKDYFKIYHNQSMVFDDRKALQFFTGHNQMLILSNLMNSMTGQVEMLRDLPPRIRLEMVKQLKKEVMFPGYKLTVAGQIGTKMYIVATGKLVIYNSDLVKIRDAWEGSYIGEYQLLKNSPYLVTAVCAEISTVYTLDRLGFNKVISHLPEEFKRIKDKITERHMNLLLSMDRERSSLNET